MSPADCHRLTFATTSQDFLATADYPLRPAVARTWGRPQRLQRRCCYFPQSFPVYRMQRLVSAFLCLLGLVLLSLVAFVLVQASPSDGAVKGGAPLHRRGPGDKLLSQEEEKEEEGLEVVRTARKLEDHPEYSRSLEEEDEGGGEEVDEEEEEELILAGEGYETDEDEEEEEDDNPVFDMDYFDFTITSDKGTKTSTRGRAKGISPSTSAFKTPRIRERWKNLPRVSLTNDQGLRVVEDGVVFSAEVEDLLKEAMLSDATVAEVQAQLRTHKVSRLEEPSWEKCGRPKNQWVELANGGAACARYRYPDDYLLLGEVLSFYLSRLLGVGHVPPVVLAEPTDPRWAGVAQEMKKAGWGDAPVVVLTPWVERLVRDRMPGILLDSLLRGVPITALNEEPHPVVLREVAAQGSNRIYQQEKRDALGKRQETSLKGVSDEDLALLLQWSDLLVFDYLTGNYDRLAYLQDAAEDEGRPDILKGTVHNLVRSEATDALWLLDNESGLMDGYSLLYSTNDPTQGTRFQTFHTRALRSLCLFRRSTMEAVLGLANHPQPHLLLVGFLKDHEPLTGKLPDPLKNDFFVKFFAQRLREVHSWMLKCAEKVQRLSRAKRS